MALICNLVQEFNGLVSKGSTAMLALLLCKIPALKDRFYFNFFQQADKLHNSALLIGILFQCIPFRLILINEQSQNWILLF